MLYQIISGGQTGADRAALDAGLELAFSIGGHCPVGRLAEDGLIDPRYSLIEFGEAYHQRTQKNVEASDGTLIFYHSNLSGGTEQTLLFCIKLSKPYKLIDTSLIEEEIAISVIRQFIQEEQIEILNVAGPRLSDCPAIYDYVKAVMLEVIQGFI
jgi:hypothetical protein